MKNVFQFGDKCFVTIGHSNIGYIGALNVVSGNALLRVIGSQPVLLHLVSKAAHQDGIARYFAHVTSAQLPHLSCNAVLFYQRFLLK